MEERDQIRLSRYSAELVRRLESSGQTIGTKPRA
jgi:hypothetical protein